MKMKREWIALVILGGLISLALVAVVFGWRRQKEIVLLEASMPEAGGWEPAAIQAVAGQPLHMSLTSQDVTHSFAVGQMDMEPVDIQPGKMTDVTLTFDHPGTYTFYCTRWCGANHWRMRGTIEVSGDKPAQAAANAEPPGQLQLPLYVQLGLDIDAPHPAVVTPAVSPSSEDFGQLLEGLPAIYRSQAYYRSHSPAQVWQDLRAEAVIRQQSDAQVWGLVAGIWQANTNPEKLAVGKKLYAQNCAACHGEGGAGDGPMADNLTQSIQSMEGHGATTPADFTDPVSMLGASPAILHGKITRGGMGTGMPYWGPIFTDEQIWALVDWLWTFQDLDK
jgi:mono/diheme cytochrome c family protein/plastocyanin